MGLLVFFILALLLLDDVLKDFDHSKVQRSIIDYSDVIIVSRGEAGLREERRG